MKLMYLMEFDSETHSFRGLRQNRAMDAPIYANGFTVFNELGPSNVIRLHFMAESENDAMVIGKVYMQEYIRETANENTTGSTD